VNTVEIELEGRALSLVVDVRRGDDPPVVCLHGIQGNRRTFAPLNRSEQLHGRALVAFDFPGFGSSPAPSWLACDVGSYATVIRAGLDRLGIDQVHLVGHSLGGMVAVHLLGQPGLDVLSLCNLEGNMVLTDCGASASIAAGSERDFVAHGYHQLLHEVGRGHQTSAPCRVAALRDVQPTVLHTVATSIVEWSTTGSLLRRFTADSPTRRLFVVGERNRHKVDVLSGRVEHVVIAGAGHFMLLENPLATADAIAKWIVGSGQAQLSHEP
jgi:pimeloyl-ACP methyl ester carboxylesterase